mgnify:CR=1 FL=1
MRNPFSRKKQFNVETRQNTGWMLLNQLIDSTFPNADRDNKQQLMKSCTGFAYALTSMISNDCALVPIRLMSKKGGNKLQTRTLDKQTKDYIFGNTSGLKAKTRDADEIIEVVEHPALKLLDEMNDYDDGINVQSDTESHCLLIGNAYWYLPKGSQNETEPVRIHLLQSDQVTIGTDKSTFRKITGYKYPPINKTLLPDEIIRFKYNNPADWLYGASPLQAALEHHNTSGNLSILLKELSKNKTGMDIYMSNKKDGTGNVMGDALTTLKKQFADFRAGRIKQDEIMYLGGMELLAIPNMNRDLPFIENLKGLFKFMCWVYGVPDSLFAQESSNRAVQGTSVRQYYNSCIKPKLIRKQSVLNAKYITKFKDYETSGLFFMIDDPVPVDIDSLIKQTGIIITQNEARKQTKHDDIENGDMLYMPSGMTPIGSQMTPEEQGKAFAKAVKEEMEKGER